MLGRRLRFSGFLAACLAALIPAGGARAALDGPARRPEPWLRSATFLSQVYTVDRKYRSMMGPSSTMEVFPDGTPAGAVEEPRLLWIVGYEAVVVGADGETPESQEFMCHSNLDLDMERHRKYFGLSPKASDRLFTLSQGQQRIRFPDGFGIPLRSDEPLRLTTQVLNNNVEGASLRLRHKVTILYIRDSEAPWPMKALYQVSANGLVLLEGKDGYYDVADADPAVHGEGCLVGGTADPSGHVYTDDYGRKFTGHWVVPPGLEVNRSNTTRFMGLRFDTTAHYIAVHLHPFARSLELRDLTAGETVFLSRVDPSEGRIGIDRIEHYSSPEGIPLFKDHEYELVSIYDNTSDVDQDSMAVMYMYVLDKEFDREKFLAAAESGKAAATAGGETGSPPGLSRDRR